ncbi:hypothetical protein D3C72_1882870 [compost metagenome]
MERGIGLGLGFRLGRHRAHGDRLAQALRDPHRIGQAGLRQHHGELFAAKARGQVEDAQRAVQDLRQRAQHAVAAGVAPAVVDLLEEIDIDHQHRQRGTATLLAPGLAPEAGAEIPAVGQACERILLRQYLQLLAQRKVVIEQLRDHAHRDPQQQRQQQPDDQQGAAQSPEHRRCQR